MTLMIYASMGNGIEVARVSRVQNVASPEEAAHAFERTGWERATMPGWLADFLRAGVVGWKSRYYHFSPAVVLRREVGDDVLWIVLGVAAPGRKARGALRPGTWVEGGTFLPQPGGWDVRI